MLHQFKVIKTRIWLENFVGFFQTNTFQNCILGLMIRLFSFLEVQISKILINFILILYHSCSYNFCCYFLFYDTTHWGLKIKLILKLFPNDLFKRHLDAILTPSRKESRDLEVSRMEIFVTLVNGIQLSTNVTVSFILFTVEVLD